SPGSIQPAVRAGQHFDDPCRSVRAIDGRLVKHLQLLLDVLPDAELEQAIAEADQGQGHDEYAVLGQEGCKMLDRLDRIGEVVERLVEDDGIEPIRRCVVIAGYRREVRAWIRMLLRRSDRNAGRVDADIPAIAETAQDRIEVSFPASDGQNALAALQPADIGGDHQVVRLFGKLMEELPLAVAVFLIPGSR